MNLVKLVLLSAYYSATAPRRATDAARRRAAGGEPVQILFYHRVADTHPNPWTMGRRQFARQIDWIAQRFDVVPLAEAQQRIASGANSRPTVAITFDDGYQENCDFALPLLLNRGLPLTYFVTTQNVLLEEPFSHDVERGTPLAPNTACEIQALAAAGVEIGAHTRTHADLGLLDEVQLTEEIVGSKYDLEKMIDRPVNYFAFPFGQPHHMSPAGHRIAYQAGFAGVCSAYGGYNFPGRDAFHLARIHADPELVRLKNWLGVDRRKLRAVEQFDPGDYAPRTTCRETPTATALTGVSS